MGAVSCFGQSSGPVQQSSPVIQYCLMYCGIQVPVVKDDYQ